MESDSERYGLSLGKARRVIRRAIVPRHLLWTVGFVEITNKESPLRAIGRVTRCSFPSVSRVSRKGGHSSFSTGDRAVNRQLSFRTEDS